MGAMAAMVEAGDLLLSGFLEGALELEGAEGGAVHSLESGGHDA
jgi:hypothetical protein